MMVCQTVRYGYSDNRIGFIEIFRPSASQKILIGWLHCGIISRFTYLFHLLLPLSSPITTHSSDNLPLLQVGSSACSLCPPGTVSHEGASECYPCPEGNNHSHPQQTPITPTPIPTPIPSTHPSLVQSPVAHPLMPSHPTITHPNRMKRALIPSFLTSHFPPSPLPPFSSRLRIPTLGLH